MLGNSKEKLACDAMENKDIENLLLKGGHFMNTETQATINRQYKSSVFAMLFKDKKELLSLYNALNHSHYTEEEKLEVVTLENAIYIYMSMKNDLAFLLDNRLSLYEHQSTPNPNMPLRDLFYVSKEYEKMIEKKSLYY